jgi:hypothetical protein
MQTKRFCSWLLLLLLLLLQLAAVARVLSVVA